MQEWPAGWSFRPLVWGLLLNLVPVGHEQLPPCFRPLVWGLLLNYQKEVAMGDTVWSSFRPLVWGLLLNGGTGDYSLDFKLFSSPGLGTSFKFAIQH